MLESLLQAYGYPALLLGTFFEGETILVLGGVAAQLGYLSLGWVITCGFVGSLLGDQRYFYLGRRHGSQLMIGRSAWQGRAQRVHRLLESRPVLLILGFRFVYGTRTVTPFVLGTSNVSYLRFGVLNAVGAGIWAIVIALAGYFFDQSMEILLGEIGRYEIAIFVSVAACGLLVWLFAIMRRHRVVKRSGDGKDSNQVK